MMKKNERTIFMRVDGGEDTPKVKATRKVVRSIIEKTGCDGAEVKKTGKLYANYVRGFVIWEGQRVSEWQDESGMMQFTEAGKPFESAFRTLMGIRG